MIYQNESFPLSCAVWPSLFCPFIVLMMAVVVGDAKRGNYGGYCIKKYGSGCVILLPLPTSPFQDCFNQYNYCPYFNQFNDHFDWEEGVVAGPGNLCYRSENKTTYVSIYQQNLFHCNERTLYAVVFKFFCF